MYQSIFISNRSEFEESTVYVWDDEKGLIKRPYSDFAYAYQRNPMGRFTSMYGDKLEKIHRFKPDTPGLFESDLARETRVLTDMYLSSDDPSKGHRVLITDIEVSSKGGYPDVAQADKEITAIANYRRDTDEYIAFILDPDKRIESSVKDNVTVISCPTEDDLLSLWLGFYEDMAPTIISGWNVDNFDIPYIIHRLNRLYGEGTSRRLSPIGKVKFNERRERYMIAGVSVLDYLPVYKKFTYTQRPSYRLDAIGKTEVDMGKVEYEGTLDDLFEKNLETFIKYTVHDVRIVKTLDDKMKLIELIRFICHLGHVPYEDYAYSSKYIEGAIITYLHRKGIVASNKPEGGPLTFSPDGEKGFDGAYVKQPIPGLYKWVYSLDLQSLYPSIIMSLNISPDTKVARVENWDVEAYVNKSQDNYIVVESGKSRTIDRETFTNFIRSQALTISSNGILYRTDKEGVIPDILDKWFKERVQFKNEMKKYAKEGNKELEEFYDRRQLVQKIMLNSVYGVLGLSIFRFYDLDNALAVTATGQDVIKTSAKFVNSLYVRETGEKKDYCIYIDTDSVYFSAAPIVDKLETWEERNARAIELARDHEKRLNTFYDTMALMLFNCASTRHRFVIKGEAIAESAFWVAKKRYAMKQVFDLETNLPVKKKKPKVKGLDVVRSSFPPAFQNFMSEVLMAILNEETKQQMDVRILDFKKAMRKLTYMDVARNTGVKNVSEYDTPKYSKLDEFKKGAPAHSKAAVTYNRMLRHLGVEKTYVPIKNGDKIKWTKLKPNPYNIPTIALKTYDDPPELIKLVEEYIDHDALFTDELEKKLEDFYDAMNWGRLPTQVNQKAFKFFKFNK